MTTYDGTTPLQPALAALCGCSIKSQGKIAQLIKQAKEGMGIAPVFDKTGRISPHLSPQQRLAIWQWHYDRLENVDTHLDTDNTATTTVDIFQQSALLEQPTTKQVETIANNNDVEINLQITTEPIEDSHYTDVHAPIEQVETLPQVNDESVEIMQRLADNAMFKFAFYTSTYGVKNRQVIGLHGCYVNALLLATGIDKKGIPAWIQSAVDSWGAFDDKLPITLQVKTLILRELESQLIKVRG